MSPAVRAGSTVVTSCAMTSSSDALLLRHGAQLRHRPLGDDAAAMEHHDVGAQALDVVEHVRAVQDRLAARRQDRNQVTQHETGREIQAGFRFVQNEQIGIVQQRGDEQHLLLHAFGVPADRLIGGAGQAEQIQERRDLARQERVPGVGAGGR